MKEKINSNNNIQIDSGFGKSDFIDIVPYDRELDLDYVSYCIKLIMKEYKTKDTNFILSVDGFSIDGLSETNKHLIRTGSVLWDKYLDEYKTIKL
tara:strand:+ start:1244 stop:1528 length:285 start_codon:yes stop_codon:yes gene_type:complete